ncbi:EAL domain-containing protein [Aliidiomarina soli]|uniref:cyclic-guanylate-specific phosphodiesterase n=1 Tax=Aliidiomarina soli TaxID=1928574 RepID=A0A432WEK6_9GAMM|nr:EAL domain-containing protein [Aliidiomarina soli]RUO31260.1 GGDEF domain-containing protein [Aliidiomarina soli]
MTQRPQLPIASMVGALDAMPVSVIIADAKVADMPIVYTNPAFEALTGYTSDEARGRNCRFLQGPDTATEEVTRVRRALHNGQSVQAVLRNYRKDGEAFWNELTLVPLLDAEDSLVFYMGVSRDATREANLSAELDHYTSHDPLTGLPNRALLEERLEQSVRLSQRYKRELAVVYLDLDGFKPINDHFGHHFGDRLLQKVAKRLQALIRPGDTLARVEGDEFAIVLSDLANATDVVIILERILAQVAEPMNVSGMDVQLSASIGVTLSSDEVEDPMVLIQQADLAMYQAKQRGRNNFQWYSGDLNASVAQFINIRNQLSKAIETDQFSLVYQPKFDLRSGQCTGVEALARWTHPVLGEVSPNEFIPVAEKTGLIVPFSEWVIRRAAADFKRLVLADPDLPSVSVNISPLHFLREHFVERLAELLTECQLDAQYLDIEVTESVLLKDPETTVRKMLALKELGVHLSLDDFGTGFSSLNYLKRLPIDTLKIDRSFIADLAHNKGDAAIIQGIVSMAHHLNMKVVAEGIETKAQYSFLRRALCDEMQGYYRARPMPLEEVAQFLELHEGLTEPEDDEKRPTLLLVDDEPNVLRSLNRLLRRDGYHVLTAETADEAFELLAQHQVQVIISDQRMRHMNGTELLNHVKSMYPGIVRIVLSGYMDLESVTAAINQGQIYKFLTKPWDDKELREVVRKAVRLAEVP